MIKTLVLQILGTSDIRINDEEAYCQLENNKDKEYNKNIIKNFLEAFESKTQDFQFPLLDKLIQQIKPENSELIFAIILTDQTQWLENHTSMSNDKYYKILKSDGFWWKDLVSAYFTEKKIACNFLIFKIEGDVEYGIANWEKNSELITPFLEKFITYDPNSNQFKFESDPSSEVNSVDKILIQHSSGTPALTSSLYLWGIEQRLAGYPIEFIYISDPEDDCLPHEGEYWQWHLRLPIIRELVEVQDFSGALSLLEKYPTKYKTTVQPIRDKLEFLDKAISFNIKGIKTELSNIVTVQGGRREIAKNYLQNLIN